MANEYISREALYNAFPTIDEDRRVSLIGVMADVYTTIGNIPTADVVEVVRCRDCKYSGMYCFGDSTDQELACLDIEDDGFIRFARSVDPNDFCSCGERRCDNGE